MNKRTAILIGLLSIISFGCIIAIPIGVLSVSYSSYDIISESFSYEYLPNDPSTVETLNLNVDFGNIEIEYVDPPIHYYVKIDVNIEMSGSGLVGKDSLDYFNINEGDTTSSPIKFSMSLLSNITESEVESVIKDISLIVTIQKGIVFDINATVINGYVDLRVPTFVHINNIEVNTNIGKISYDFSNCFVEGNITAFTNQGDIKLKSQNTQYIRNSIWYLKSVQDSVVFDIDQSNDMGANVTGYGESLNSFVTIIYDDYSSTVGAWFKLVNQTSGHPDDPAHIFNSDGWTPNYALDSGYEFISNDFPAKNNYNMSLYSHVGRTFFRWILYNEP